MKKILFINTLGLLTAITTYAQVDSSGTVASSGTQTVVMRVDSTVVPATTSDSTVALLDKAVAANQQGDKTATVQALQAGATAMETEAKSSTGSFKDKLVKQAANLKKLVPLLKTGGLSGNLLQKAVGLAKTAFAANKIETLLGGGSSGSLLSNLGGITSNLGILKSALPSVGGSKASTGTSLVSGAISSLSKLGQAGPVASVAEPVVRSQLTGLLSLVKGIL